MSLNKQQKLVAGYAAAMFIALVMAWTGGSDAGQPGYADAFPDAKLVTEETSGTLDTYVFLSDASFDQAERELAGFLGPAWSKKKMVEDDYKQLAQHLDADTLESLTGLALYVNGSTPGARISLAQSKAPMSGNKVLTTLLVVKPAPASGGH